MINAKLTAKLVAEKFGREDGFDTSYFLHLADIYIRNDRALYERAVALGDEDVRDEIRLAMALIAHVIKWDACDGEDPSAAGVKAAIPAMLWFAVAENVIRPFLEEEKDV